MRPLEPGAVNEVRGAAGHPGKDDGSVATATRFVLLSPGMPALRFPLMESLSGTSPHAEQIGQLLAWQVLKERSIQGETP